MWFLFGEVSSSSGCLDGLRYFIVALTEPSISLFMLWVYFCKSNVSLRFRSYNVYKAFLHLPTTGIFYTDTLRLPIPGLVQFQVT